MSFLDVSANWEEDQETYCAFLNNFCKCAPGFGPSLFHVHKKQWSFLMHTLIFVKMKQGKQKRKYSCLFSCIAFGFMLGRTGKLGRENWPKATGRLKENKCCFITVASLSPKRQHSCEIVHKIRQPRWAKSSHKSFWTFCSLSWRKSSW